MTVHMRDLMHYYFHCVEPSLEQQEEVRSLFVQNYGDPPFEMTLREQIAYLSGIGQGVDPAVGGNMSGFVKRECPKCGPFEEAFHAVPNIRDYHDVEGWRL